VDNDGVNNGDDEELDEEEAGEDEQEEEEDAICVGECGGVMVITVRLGDVDRCNDADAGCGVKFIGCESSTAEYCCRAS
jgi:hypothetical protein